MGHPRREPADGSQARRAEHLVLRLRQLGGGRLQLRQALFELGSVGAHLAPHRVEGARQPAHLSGPALGHLDLRTPLGEARRGQGHLLQGPNDQEGQRDVGEQEDEHPGEADVEDPEIAKGSAGRASLLEPEDELGLGEPRHGGAHPFAEAGGAPGELDPGPAERDATDPTHEGLLRETAETLGLDGAIEGDGEGAGERPRVLVADARPLAAPELEAGRTEHAEGDREGDREGEADLEPQAGHGSP